MEITNDALILEGERRSEREQNDRGIQRSERQYGAFYRSIPLPEGANVEQATARYENGVLEITIPTPQQRESASLHPRPDHRQAPVGAQAGQPPDNRPGSHSRTTNNHPDRPSQASRLILNPPAAGLRWLFLDANSKEGPLGSCLRPPSRSSQP